jgi:3-methyladenine DNA glycosylase AlkD
MPAINARSGRTPPARLTYAQVMAELEAAGSAQTRKTYLRHGASEPLFGVSFAMLKAMLKRIKVDHELAIALWDSGNYDARNLAVKVVDPSAMAPADLDRWARGAGGAMCTNYVALVAVDGPHARSKVSEWLASAENAERTAGWSLLGQLALRDESLPDAWFATWLDTIERTIHTAPNSQREAMNQSVIGIGCRNQALRGLATAAARRIGPVEIDHGDTACETRDAASDIEKSWAHATARGVESPAAAERGREPLRLRC